MVVPTPVVVFVLVPMIALTLVGEKGKGGGTGERGGRPCCRRCLRRFCFRVRRLRFRHLQCFRRLRFLFVVHGR